MINEHGQITQIHYFSVLRIFGAELPQRRRRYISGGHYLAVLHLFGGWSQSVDHRRTEHDVEDQGMYFDSLTLTLTLSDSL